MIITRENSDLAISYMRFMAAILITNYHIWPLYPPYMQFIGTGGPIGNSLFFFCSGYALYKSNIKIGFTNWIIRRFSRIYPSVWIFISVCFLIHVAPLKALDFIVPPFWFLQAILCFYVLFYCCMKYCKNRLFIPCIVAAILFFTTYFLVDHSQSIVENTENNHFLHWYFYYIIMLLGAIFAQKEVNIKRMKLSVSFSLFILSIIIYYSIKKIVIPYTNIIDFQLLIPAALMMIPYFAFHACLELSHKARKMFNKVATFISNLTLDIYIVQFVIMGYFATYAFPYGFILSVTGIVLASYLLNKASSYVTNLIRKLLVK